MRGRNRGKAESQKIATVMHVRIVPHPAFALRTFALRRGKRPALPALPAPPALPALRCGGMLRRLLNLDHSVRAWIVTHRVHLLDGVMVAISMAGRGGAVWLALGIALRIARRLSLRRLIELGCAILLASVLADYVLKPAVNRQRPFAVLHDFTVIGDLPNRASFPSGRAANAFAGATVLAWALPAWQGAWWALAGLIAFSRIYLGVHYPADVVGGGVVGALSAIVVLFASAALTRQGVKGT
jgi:undecaprenyl-diphosphatase